MKIGKDIIWHIDTETTTYIEAIDGGEKTHSCYAYKYIDGKKYWFDFDGLLYLMDETLLRLTQEDCLTAILILESMHQVQQ